MSENLPPLPPDLAALLRRESDGYADDASLKADVRAHVEWAIALAAPIAPSTGASIADAPSAAATKIASTVMTKKLAIVAIAAFVAGAGAGGGAVHFASPRPAPSSIAVPASSTPTASVAQSADVAPSDADRRIAERSFPIPLLEPAARGVQDS